MNSIIEKLYSFCEWLMKLTYLNLLWICFSLLGLVIFGAAPAFAASSTITKKWLSKETDIPIFSTFLHVYKTEFVSSNKVAIIMAGIGASLYLNLLILSSESTILHQIFFPLTICLIAIYIMVFPFIFPVLIHFKAKTIQGIKLAIFSSLLNIHYTVLMLVILSLVMLIFMIIPAAFLLIGISVISMVFNWGASLSFQRSETLYQKNKIRI